MKNETWLKSAIKNLETAGIVTARLDAMVLLEDITKKDRGWLLAHTEFVLTKLQVENLNKLVERRAKHEPLAYIRGKTEFFGREFIITKDVLEPRPESETMIELLEKLSLPKSPRIADVGAGSGALGITAALEQKNAKVDLLEIDPNAIKIAKLNVAKYKLEVAVLYSDLLEQSNPPYHALLCNLPYVPDNFQINPAAQAEPRLAIFGGHDGLDTYRQLFEQLTKSSSWRPKYILTESMPPQHETLAKIAKSTGYHLLLANDFIQIFH